MPGACDGVGFLAEYRFGGAVFGANPPRCSRVFSADDRGLCRALRQLSAYATGRRRLCPNCPPRSRCSARSRLRCRTSSPRPRILCRFSRIGRPSAKPPSEDELIAHFVVPFLRALGWAPERIAVQWRHIDVAVFRALPRIPENCHFVIEAKRLGAGVEGALEQAKGYVEALELPRDVVVTDGVRYRMYDAEHALRALAYANLARLKQPAADLFARMQRP